MHLRFVISLLFLWVFRGQFYGPRQRNEMFNRRRCPPQLDRTVFKCVRQFLIEVPHYIHSQTQMLDLSGNKLTILHESNFANLNRLIRLVLDDNKIWKITQNTFLPLVKLSELSLRNNHLAIDIDNSITARILAPLTTLQRLDLSYNPLGIIPDNLFVNSSTINCLILDSVGNPLRLMSKSFWNLAKLELLSLEENQLSTLPEKIFLQQRKLDIYNIRLSRNPWNCNCSLKWLRISLETSSQSNHINNLYFLNPNMISNKKHIPSCSSPLQWKGFPLSQVPMDKFQCKVEIFVRKVNLTASVGSDVGMVCQFFFSYHDNATITWYHNKRLVIPSSNLRQYDDHAINRTSILNISSVNFRDSGIYECQMRTKHDSIKETLYLAVLKSPDETIISGIRIIFTIGTILAAIIIVIVAILAIVYLIKHRSVFCSDNSKLDPVFNGKTSEHDVNEHAPIPFSNSPVMHNNTPQNESALTVMKCSGNDYLSLRGTRQNYPNQPYMFLPKPTFQCTHNRPFLLNRSSSSPRDYPYEDSTNGEMCDSCALSESRSTVDSYRKCPLHGHRVQSVSPHSLSGEPILPESTNPLVNINCPLHGCKSENLFYYELSNN